MTLGSDSGAACSRILADVAEALALPRVSSGGERCIGFCMFGRFQQGRVWSSSEERLEGLSRAQTQLPYDLDARYTALLDFLERSCRHSLLVVRVVRWLAVVGFVLSLLTVVVGLLVIGCVVGAAERPELASDFGAAVSSGLAVSGTLWTAAWGLQRQAERTVTKLREMIDQRLSLAGH